MQKISVKTAQRIVNSVLANTQAINPANVQQALATVKGTTFASLTTCAKVATIAAYKNEKVYKISKQNVLLCNSNSNIYENAVSKEVQENFQAQMGYYTPVNGSYSFVTNKNATKHYLRGLSQSCSYSVYYCAKTERFLSKKEVAQLMFASEPPRKKFIEGNKETYVQHADVTHTQTPRVFMLERLYNVSLNKHVLQA